MKNKIFGVFTLVLVISTLLTGFISLSLVTNSYTKELEKRLISNGRLIEGVINENQQLMDREELQRLANDLGSKIHAQITIIDKRGNILADTLQSDNSFRGYNDGAEVEDALGGKIGKIVRYNNTLDRGMIYVALPVAIKDTDIAVIRLSMDLVERDKINQQFFYYTGASIIFSLIAALLLGYRFIDKFMDPVKEITDISKKIASGEFDRRVKIESNDEIGELASNFNDMADHLENTILQLYDNNTKFKALLSGLINPIVAVDNNQHIILFNQAAEILFNLGTKKAIGNHIEDVIRNNMIDEQLIEIFSDGYKSNTEITITRPSKKILKIHINPIFLGHDTTKVIGKVALIEDVTEIRRLENMRSNFVTNVSHELKTPLTSISGFIETLKLGAIEDQKTAMRFLDIIDIETDRLKRLINDILTLSEIESIDVNVTVQEISPSKVLREIEDIIRPIADVKEIEFHTDIDDKLPYLYGNSDWFKQLIINLIDNAIKYTPSKGRVELVAFKRQKQIMIRVKDTGMGIREEDVDRIFERFYRVDKARTRKIGGTGLGLAIAKHIVLSFNGEIKVNSEYGRGTEFIVKIPL